MPPRPGATPGQGGTGAFRAALRTPEAARWGRPEREEEVTAGAQQHLAVTRDGTVTGMAWSDGLLDLPAAGAHRGRLLTRSATDVSAVSASIEVKCRIYDGVRD